MNNQTEVKASGNEAMPSSSPQICSQFQFVHRNGSDWDVYVSGTRKFKIREFPPSFDVIGCNYARFTVEGLPTLSSAMGCVCDYLANLKLTYENEAERGRIK